VRGPVGLQCHLCGRDDMMGVAKRVAGQAIADRCWFPVAKTLTLSSTKISTVHAFWTLRRGEVFKKNCIVPRNEKRLFNRQSNLYVQRDSIRVIQWNASLLTPLAGFESIVLNVQDVGGIVLRYGSLYGPGTPLSTDGKILEMVRRRQLPLVGNDATSRR